MILIIYLVLHINYQKKNNNNKMKKMKNFLIKYLIPIWALIRGLKVTGLKNIQQIKKVFLKINL